MRRTIGDAYFDAKKRLRLALADHPFATPDLDARLLLSAACNVSDQTPFLQPDLVVNQDHCRRLEAFLNRRAKGEPVARILGEKWFWGLCFTVNEHTLTPRPETEGLVEIVLAWAETNGRTSMPLRLLDIGAGSGAILISLLSELPQAFGVAVDISIDALRVAKENAVRHDVSDRFLPLVSDYCSALDGCFDVIVSNPPYIAWSERDNLMCEVKEFDPPLALFAEEDGLAAYHLILPWMRNHISDDGLCVVEHGAEQAQDVGLIAKTSGFQRTECVFDLAGLSRFAKLSLY